MVVEIEVEEEEAGGCFRSTQEARSKKKKKKRSQPLIRLFKKNSKDLFPHH